MRTRALAFLAASCAILGTSASLAATPIVHVQTDKPSYRLGDVVWFRVHASQGAPDKLEVSLVREGGVRVATKGGTVKPDQPLEGSFAIPEDVPGGTWKIVASSGERVLHEVSLEVYDVTARALDLDLAVIGDFAVPGSTAVATLCARTLQGKPLAGEVAKWTARFGPLAVSGTTPALDDEGRAVIRFEVPANAPGSGWLSVGVESQKVQGAVAKPVRVYNGVGRVDAFPEGGAIVEGCAGRIALLVRAPSGEPLPCEGRILDDQDRLCDGFTTDRRGLALVDVPHAKGRSYSVVVDRPAGVATRFPLPGPTGHARALRIDTDERGAVAVHLHGRRTTRPTRVVLVTAAGTRFEDVEIGKDGGEATVHFPVDAVSFGAGYVLVTSGEKPDLRAELKTPIVFGDHWALDVTLTPRPGKLLPGEVATFDAVVSDRASHKPVQADLAFSAFQKGAGEDGLEDLPVRALLQPFVSGTVSDASDLWKLSTLFGRDLRTAYVLVRGSFVYPPEGGVPVVAKSGLPDEAVGRVDVPEIVAPPPPEAPRQGDTVAQGTALERLMERAPWTRHGLARAESDRKLERIDQGATPELPVKAHAGQLPPQDTQVPWSKVDCRDTLLWRGRVVTDANGHATLPFRLGHELSTLRIAGEGFAKGGIAVATGTQIVAPGTDSRPTEVKPLTPFSSRFEFPTHLTVGDTLDLHVATDVNDGSPQPLLVELQVPPCLRALDRVQRTMDPRKDEVSAKFRFEVVAPVRDARITVSTTRAPFRETATARFNVSLRELELSCGRSGIESGVQTLACKVPADAVPGSVTAFSRVVDSRDPANALVGTPAGSTVDRNDWVLREPTGCFEQTTSANYPNLVILSRLVQSGGDAHVISQAMDLCNKGYERILAFQNSAGGFSLWQGSPDVQPRYTAMAIVQLALYGQLFQGRGAGALAKAVAWLRAHDSPGEDTEAVFIALEANEAGVAAVATHALTHEPRTNYERALLANCVVEWKQAWPLKKDRGALLRELAAPLARALDPKTGRVPTTGSGIMGSTGDQLDAETAALSAVALKEAGFYAPAHECMKFLATLKASRGNVVGTRANALALRALDRLGFLECDVSGKNDRRDKRGAPLEPARNDPVVVSFSAGGVESTSFVGGARNRPLAFEVPLAAAPGSTVALGLDMKTSSALEYGLGLHYRVATPHGSPDAPFTLRTSLAPIVVGGQEASIQVTIEPTGKKVEGQVLVQIAIPGGCEPILGPTGLDHARNDAIRAGSAGAIGAIERRDGSVLFYFERAPETTCSFSVPIRGVTPGNYLAPPSTIYPYYESGREAYAAPLETKVLTAYDASLAAAAQERGPIRPPAPAHR